jgi:multiple sugar transport system permease protein
MLTSDTGKTKKHGHPTPGKIAGNTAYFILLFALAVFFLFPFFVMLSRSFMTTTESLSLDMRFFPEKLNWQSYATAVDRDFLQYLGNTAIVLVCNVIGPPLTGVMAAFAFAKLNFKGKNLIFGVCMGTVMLPGIVTQIPLFMIYAKLGLDQTLLPLIIPAFLGGSILSIFMVRQFFKTLPPDLDDAARIDGAGILRWLFSVTMPLVMPVVVFIGVNGFLSAWNDFSGPLIYLNNQSMYTLPVGVYKKFIELPQSDAETLPNVQMAVGVIMTLPPAVIFVIFQKQLVEGITITGIKG